ncbi:unnamed protein product [Eruca vesicaria subsp. sativa]|uniref:Uncharacterized protein n=1 Tax=Eruca vesicaria subsp. sativa TaxID=29727 RepID=A0ABC8ISB5_ERUVS|nr:unnamed protein product [Eruca vesicaria subsp. sativa]
MWWCLLFHDMNILLYKSRFTFQKPATSQSQAVLGDVVADKHETTPLHTAVPSLPLHERLVLQKPATSQLQADLREKTSQRQAEFRADKHGASLVHTVVPSPPVTEHIPLQKPATSQSQAEIRVETRKASLVHTVMPSFAEWRLPIYKIILLNKYKQLWT